MKRNYTKKEKEEDASIIFLPTLLPSSFRLKENFCSLSLFQQNQNNSKLYIDRLKEK